MFWSNYNSQKGQKKKKQWSQESRLFFNGKNICKFTFKLLKLFGKNISFSCMQAGKFILQKSFDIHFMKVNSCVKKKEII